MAHFIFVVLKFMLVGFCKSMSFSLLLTKGQFFLGLCHGWIIQRVRKGSNIAC